MCFALNHFMLCMWPGACRFFAFCFYCCLLLHVSCVCIVLYVNLFSVYYLCSADSFCDAAGPWLKNIMWSPSVTFYMHFCWPRASIEKKVVFSSSDVRTVRTAENMLVCTKPVLISGNARFRKLQSSHAIFPGYGTQHKQIPRLWAQHQTYSQVWAQHEKIPRLWAQHKHIPRLWAQHKKYSQVMGPTRKYSKVVGTTQK